MRTNIDIDDRLMAAALAAGPFKTKKAAVEAGLRLLEQQAAARALLALRGKVTWGWGDEERLDGKPNVVRSEEQSSPRGATRKNAKTTTKTGKADVKRAGR